MLKSRQATTIHEIEAFASTYGEITDDSLAKDDFFYFCQITPTFDESIQKFGDSVCEAELENIIMIQKGIVKLS